jgi:hypothetical protein
MVSLPQPHRYVCRGKCGMDHSGEVSPDGVRVNRVLQPGGERRHHLLGVVPGPVGAPVHGVLDPSSDGLNNAITPSPN